MVVIRLARGGSKKRPFYNIVATDSRNRRDGRFNERLSINEASLNAWVANGAQMSDTVARLYKEFKKAAAPAA